MAALSPWCIGLLALALAGATAPGRGQTFHYVDAGIASCPAAPTPSTAAPKTVAQGAAVAGALRVACGFDQGSYTVTLNTSDPQATVAPKTFLVNFGRLVGNGNFTVRFSTPGMHSVSTAITSNMGSPAVRGQFMSAASTFNVVAP